MTLDDIMAKLQPAVEKFGGLEKPVNMKFGDAGTIHISGTELIPEEREAACTISADLETFEALMTGSKSIMSLFMKGKFKVDGDTTVAMGLMGLF